MKIIFEASKERNKEHYRLAYLLFMLILIQITRVIITLKNNHLFGKNHSNILHSLVNQTRFTLRILF